MIGGHNEWDLMAEFFVSHTGMPAEDAKAFVVIRWMNNGDSRPLAAAIRESGGTVDRAILASLAKLIDDGRLKLDRKGAGRHRPRNPATEVKRIVAALAYENSDQPTSDERFRHVAEMLRMSEEAVRGHYTAWKKARRKS
jgi:hypothetical protein